MNISKIVTVPNCIIHLFKKKSFDLIVPDIVLSLPRLKQSLYVVKTKSTKIFSSGNGEKLSLGKRQWHLAWGASDFLFAQFTFHGNENIL